MTAYVVNGRTMTADEFAAHSAKRTRLHGGVAGIVSAGVAPGGHAPYWGTGHVSFGLGCSTGERAEYDQFLKEKGCNGYTLNDDGSMSVASPENWRKIKAANGVEEQTPYGTGKKRTDIPEKKPRSHAPDPEKLRAAAHRIRQSESVRRVLGE